MDSNLCSVVRVLGLNPFIVKYLLVQKVVMVVKKYHKKRRSLKYFDKGHGVCNNLVNICDRVTATPNSCMRQLRKLSNTVERLREL